MNLPQKIVTKRLILKLINQNDFEVFTEILKDSDVIKNLNFISKEKSESDAKNLFKLIIESYNSITQIIIFIIFNKESGDHIGLCGLLPSRNQNGVECFYTVLHEYRGRGFAIEAMKKLIEYAFEVLELGKITLFLDPTNSRAWKVAERVGMKYLGHVTHKNIASKMMYFSIDKAEFKAQGYY